MEKISTLAIQRNDILEETAITFKVNSLPNKQHSLAVFLDKLLTSVLFARLHNQMSSEFYMCFADGNFSSLFLAVLARIPNLAVQNMFVGVVVPVFFCGYGIAHEFSHV